MIAWIGMKKHVLDLAALACKFYPVNYYFLGLELGSCFLVLDFNKILVFPENLHLAGETIPFL